ncbi:hypothetical protein NDU88_006275 [Pleurodeles waltl]|uniref:Uncharacterized protein n=1 Tax=Pleurodeles waltl TaxID=8319 RepID=A0AAV7UKJ3_PLEWA|nr:hypothetical protein NDU88_006275 [Pleurodeles waltl]
MSFVKSKFRLSQVREISNNIYQESVLEPVEKREANPGAGRGEGRGSNGVAWEVPIRINHSDYRDQFTACVLVEEASGSAGVGRQVQGWLYRLLHLVRQYL